MNSATFAAIQMNSAADVAANLATASELLERAAADGAVLAVLPENFAFMGAANSDRVLHAERDGQGPMQDFLATVAARTGMWIVGGTLPLQGEDPARPFASCLVYDDRGRRVGRYDKVHLFDVNIPGRNESYRESANTEAGRELLTVKTPWGGMGVAVCYDLRFPEMFRTRSADALNILAIPSAFTFSTGQAHWNTLLRARAIENLCYVVAAAQAGSHPAERMTWGHSLIIGPWGETLAGDDTLLTDAAVKSVVAALDFAKLSDVRKKFPALAHRRFRVSEPAPQKD